MHLHLFLFLGYNTDVVSWLQSAASAVSSAVQAYSQHLQSQAGCAMGYGC